MFGAGSLAGCGVSQELYNARTTELERCRAELSRTQHDLQSSRAQNEEEAGARQHAATVEAEYLRLRRDLKATEQQLAELLKARRQAERRSALYRALMAKLRAMIDARTLGVEIRKGKMLVKLGDQVLFDPGRAELTTAGQATLRQVAAALREIPDRDFLVAGHTDNAPVRSSPYKSNWELSAARAITVVRFLQAEGVNPSHLAAAGYSEFDRLGENDSPNRRALNRRIEIVVMPSLEELPPIDPAAADEEEAAEVITPPPAPAP